MTLLAVEGGAGCGKTYRLMEALREELALNELRDGQRVLALTFMHGARRRLHEKLCAMDGLRGRIECLTVDSFAQKIVRRWRGLASALGIPPLGVHEFDAQCDAAARLLARPEVRSWVASSFPVVLVDEAQDLKPERLRMISPMAESTRLLVAADEFQCLSANLRPNPFVEWMRQACVPEVLDRVHRTNVAELLDAATAIREGRAPVDGRRSFRILPARGASIAATYLANAIAWRQGGNVAVITPSLAGPYAQDIVAKVGQRAWGQQGNGPYTIRWERSEDQEVEKLINGFQLAEHSSVVETIAALNAIPPTAAIKDAKIWVQRQARAGGGTRFNRDQIVSVISRMVAMRRQHMSQDGSLLTAMTVQQAKNREFDGVVVLWPFQVGGDAEHKRRLLYNAVTRAKRWCTVIPQSQDLLGVPPFA